MRPRLFGTPSGINFTKRSGKGRSGGAKKLENHLLYKKKYGDDLGNVSSSDLRKFASRVDEIVGEDNRIGNYVNKQEMRRIIDRVARETGDRIDPREAAIIKKAIFEN